VFTLRLLGYDRTRNYDGSMGEWANRDHTPLVMETAG
jgi:3-mercaptopyruvate sulfurtransferase SseA